MKMLGRRIWQKLLCVDIPHTILILEHKFHIEVSRKINKLYNEIFLNIKAIQGIRGVCILLIHPKLEVVSSFSEYGPLMIAPKVKFHSCLLENIPMNTTCAGMTS